MIKDVIVHSKEKPLSKTEIRGYFIDNFLNNGLWFHFDSNVSCKDRVKYFIDLDVFGLSKKIKETAIEGLPLNKERDTFEFLCEFVAYCFYTGHIFTSEGAILRDADPYPAFILYKYFTSSLESEKAQLERFFDMLKKKFPMFYEKDSVFDAMRPQLYSILAKIIRNDSPEKLIRQVFADSFASLGTISESLEILLEFLNKDQLKKIIPKAAKFFKSYAKRRNGIDLSDEESLIEMIKNKKSFFLLENVSGMAFCVLDALKKRKLTPNDEQIAIEFLEKHFPDLQFLNLY